MAGKICSRLKYEYKKRMTGDTEAHNEDLAGSLSAYIISALVAVLTIALFITAMPRYTGLSQHRLAAEDISVLPHEDEGPLRRKRANEVEYDLKSAHNIPKHLRRQYTYTFQLTHIPNNAGEVFIPFIGGTATAYMNGVAIGYTQENQTKIAGFSRYYFWEDIPIANYQKGINRLTVVLTPDSSFTGLPKIYLGDTGDFKDAINQGERRANALRILQLYIGGAVILFSFIGVLIRGFSRLKVHIPSALLGACLMFFSTHSGPSDIGFVEFQNTTAAWVNAVLALALLALFHAVRNAPKPIELGFWAAAMVSTVVAALAILPITKPLFMSTVSYLPLGGTLPFAVFFTASRFLHDRHAAQMSKAKLERKIEDQKNTIQAQETAIQETLKAKGRLEERQRLTRDIHDGIGGQLLSLLVRVRDGDMSQSEIESDLQYGLNDLRLIVDSMDHSEGSFENALVTFRERANAQLRATGIVLNWEQSTPFVPTFFQPATILNIFRLMQEAITNVIRHSKCDQMTIQISRKSLDEEMVILLTDNGVGFKVDALRLTGQGVKNMKYRAKAIGGDLVIGTGASGGTQVRLSIRSESGDE